MPTRPSTFPGRVSDGWGPLPMGVNSGIAANLIEQTQCSFAINRACRGGWTRPRPAYRKIALNFNGDAEIEMAFKTGMFQVLGGYQVDDGTASLISMQGGRQFKVNIDSTSSPFSVSEITIPGDRNPNNRAQAWSIQAENYFIIQDGQTKPFIFSGASATRALPQQIPVGNMMTYWNGRIWVAKGREYVAGNIVRDPTSGSAAKQYRDSILWFTDNDYLNEGGSFSVPVQSGDITGFKSVASANTALGEGELIVFTIGNAFATTLPADRTQWKNLQYPVQRMIQLSMGAYSQDSIVNVNEDLFFRTKYGVSTVQYTVRNNGQWGARPLSTEMNRILAYDSPEFLPFCRATQFNNRYLVTASPGVSRNHGVYWRGLIPLDFYPISSMASVAPPAWDGLWTGLNILKLVTLIHKGVERCFAYALNQLDEIDLWEICKDGQYTHDWDGDTEQRIEWALESRSMNFSNQFNLKELQSSDFFFDELNGECELTFQYRPDDYPCWVPWHTETVCAKVQLCESDFTGTCVSLPNFKPQYSPRIQLPQPDETFQPLGVNGSQMFRTFWELQVRISGKGYIRCKQMRCNAVFKGDFVEGAQIV